MDKLNGVITAAQLCGDLDLDAGLGLEAAAFQLFDARRGHGHAVILLHTGLGEGLLKPRRGKRKILPDAPGYEFHETRELRYVQPQYLAFATVTGYQLWFWYKNRRFCGCCGKPMKHDTKERMMYCPSCGRREYPVLMPAVIVGITNGDKIICSKYEGRSFKQYALIAGFAEIGETIEETVQREVMEEVGLKVKNLRYYKSQPWSFSGTLLFGFFCDVDGEDTLTVDHEELSIAQWFERDQIIGQDNNSSLTNEMMMVFAAGKEPK